MKEPRGLIFDIKRFAIHDGAGVRTTVFMKGCPLTCIWCHNPESQFIEPELIIRKDRCIESCQRCLLRCPHHAVTGVNPVDVNREKCRGCGACVSVCPSGALELSGKWMTPREVMNRISRDRLMIDTSGGGVTISGGEPLLQPRFLISLLRHLRRKGVHTVLDTSGHGAREVLEETIPLVDRYLYDLKIMDEGMHRRYTGMDNRTIRKNLVFLSREGAEVEVRIPLIPGITDGSENIREMIRFLQTQTSGIQSVTLLPFHRMGESKMEGIGKTRPGELPKPDAHPETREACRLIREAGIQCRTGG